MTRVIKKKKNETKSWEKDLSHKPNRFKPREERLPKDDPIQCRRRRSNRA